MNPNSNSGPETSATDTAITEPPSTSNPPVAPSTKDDIAPQAAKSTNSSKMLTWCLAILAIVGIIAAGIFAYLYFTTPASDPSPAPTPENTPTSDITDESETTEEIEITDLAVIDDLDKKIAILFNTDNTDRTFKTGMGIGYYSLQLFREGDISESSKVRSVITHALELKPLDKERVDAAVSQNGYSGETEQFFRESVKGIDGDSVAQKYKEIFGKTLVKGEIEEYCGRYKYNKQYDFYYSGIPGCGGRSPYSELYYKYRYTEDDNHAYIYTSTAVISPTFGTTPEGYNTEDAPFYVYCDVSYLGDNGIAEDAEVCATLQSYDEKEAFTLNASNYEQYSKYRFVFDKDGNGNYYFNKVEKL